MKGMEKRFMVHYYIQGKTYSKGDSPENMTVTVRSVSDSTLDMIQAIIQFEISARVVKSNDDFSIVSVQVL